MQRSLALYLQDNIPDTLNDIWSKTNTKILKDAILYKQGQPFSGIVVGSINMQFL